MKKDYLFQPAGKGVVAARSARVGDFVLTHGDSIYSKAIRFGQFYDLLSKGYPIKEAKRLSWWNHVAVVVGHDRHGIPILAEALGKGVIYTSLSRYYDSTYYLIRTGMIYWDQKQVQEFAKAVIKARHGYGFAQIAGIIVSILLRTPLRIGWGNTRICSGFGAECGARGGEIYDETPWGMWPVHFAIEYDVPVE